jgi:hypothetical protein
MAVASAGQAGYAGVAGKVP